MRGIALGSKALARLSILLLVALIVVTGWAIYQDWFSEEAVLQAAKVRETYQVEEGDTPKSIAELFGVEEESLREENPGVEIEEGATIKVPVREEIYTIRAGDSLKSIAREKKVPVVRLKAANQLDAEGAEGDGLLVVGDELIVPLKDGVKDRITLWASLFPALFVLALWLALSSWQKGSEKNVRDVILGDAGRYSISKLQMILWTGCFIFSYMVVMVARKLNGESFVTEIPEALVALMGISIATFSTAKAIVQGQQPPQSRWVNKIRMKRPFPVA